MTVSGGFSHRKEFSTRDLGAAVKICEDNWIFQWRHLREVPLDRLRGLGLPLYLENEMAKAVRFYQEQV